MIRIKCTSCARALGIDESQIGKPSFCPACGLVFTVPAPAVLLEDSGADGPGVKGGAVDSPRTPAVEHRAPAPAHASREPLLPEGPIALVGDGMSAAPNNKTSAPDRWEPSRRAAAADAPVPLADAPLSPQQESTPTPTAATASDDVSWSFLSIEPESPEIELSIVEDLAAAAAAGQAEGLTSEADDVDVPQAPPAGFGLVADAMPAEKAPAPPVPQAIPVSTAEAEQLLMAGPAPLAAPVASLATPIPSSQPVVWAEPVPEATASATSAPVIEWDEAAARPMPFPAQRPKKSAAIPGAVSLIPGVDDFFPALGAVLLAWLITAIIVANSPRVAWLGVAIGILFWLGGNIRFAWDLHPAILALLIAMPLSSLTFYFVFEKDAAVRFHALIFVVMLLVGVLPLVRQSYRDLRPLAIGFIGALIVLTSMLSGLRSASAASGLDFTR